jgi:hypothetical protein
MPAPPADPPPSPFEWGKPGRIRELFGSAFDLKFEECVIERLVPVTSRARGRSSGPRADRAPCRRRDYQSSGIGSLHYSLRWDFGSSSKRKGLWVGGPVPLGLLPHARKGMLFINSSTIDVDSARRGHELAGSAGVLSVDAPVSGGNG